MSAFGATPGPTFHEFELTLATATVSLETVCQDYNCRYDRAAEATKKLYDVSNSAIAAARPDSGDQRMSGRRHRHDRDHSRPVTRSPRTGGFGQDSSLLPS